MKTIPQYEPLYGEEEIQAVMDYLRSGGWLTEFRQTQRLEQMICEFTGARYCVACSNGTVSLFLMLKAAGIGPGDEVIVPALTMAATANAVILAGATPIFADIEETSLCIGANQVRHLITSKTKAIIHVSLNGRAGKLNELKKLCQEENILLLEDAAQALGSWYEKKHLGTIGMSGSFSLSMHKIITTGQGGLIVTNNKSVYRKIRLLKDFGRPRGGEDFYQNMGWNFKFTDLQAVFGIEQFKKIQKRIMFKKQIFQQYLTQLADVPQIKFIATDLTQTTPWFIDILVPKRKALFTYLASQGIITRPIYPALPTQPAYRDIVKKQKTLSYPIARQISKMGLWLPSAFSLTEQQITEICNVIKKFFSKRNT